MRFLLEVALAGLSAVPGIVVRTIGAILARFRKRPADHLKDQLDREREIHEIAQDDDALRARARRWLRRRR